MFATVTAQLGRPFARWSRDKRQRWATILLAAVFAIYPLLTDDDSNIDTIANAMSYATLALGLNIVVGFAGLLDLGYAAFFAIGAYYYGIFTAYQVMPPWTEFWAPFAWLGLVEKINQGGPDLVHFTLSFWLALPTGAAVAGFFGLLFGYPTLKLRGDYLAIVTLGFGEIVRVFLNNLDAPVNVTNGPKGITGIDEISIFGVDLGKTQHLFGLEMPKVTNYYFLFLVLVVFAVVICHRLERSRIGRAWMAIREDEIAAKAMGINTRNLKLLAFGMGATFGGVSGTMFASFQGFISPESFSLQESVMIVAMVVLGGIGHLPGVIVGALLLSALPEVLRYVAGPLQQMTDGRLDASILRQLLIALAMIGIMLSRPRGLWPSPEHGKLAPAPPSPRTPDDPSVPQPVGPNVSEVTNENYPSGTRHA